MTHWGACRRPADHLSRGLRLLVGLVVFAVSLAGCGASVNPEPLPTSTPYPIQSPVSSLSGAQSLVLPTVEAILAAGERSLEAGDAAAAESAFSTAVAADPGNAAAFTARGTVILLQAEGNTERYQAALSDFNRALALQPGYAAAYLGRARVYADRALFRGDQEDWNRALDELNALPDSTDATVATVRATALARQGDTEAAYRILDDTESALAQTATATELGLLATARATVALIAGDWDLAVESAEAAIRHDPTQWDAYRVLAEAELARDHPERALETTIDLLGRIADDGRGLYLKGLALAALGDDVEARATLEEAGQRLARSPVYQAKVTQALREI